jgi:hypothetical protein
LRKAGKGSVVDGGARRAFSLPTVREKAMSRLFEDEFQEPLPVPPLDEPDIPPADVAQYVERMCAELTSLSERSGLAFLAYLLEVAREEARLNAPPPPPTDTRHGELPPR